VDFVFDANGQRLSESFNNKTVNFAYNGVDAWLDLESTGTVVARYLLGSRVDEMIYRRGGNGGDVWYLADHLKSVRNLVTRNGFDTNSIRTSAFGFPLESNASQLIDRFLFTGREYIRPLAFTHHRARLAINSLNRFNSSDPIGFASGETNLYRITRNNPLMSTDPTGLIEAVEYTVSTTPSGATVYSLGSSSVTLGELPVQVIAAGSRKVIYETTLNNLLKGIVLEKRLAWVDKGIDLVLGLAPGIPQGVAEAGVSGNAIVTVARAILPFLRGLIKWV
jgi:RHS repeat-associated protein